MKISIDIECTPEEARQFLGLPDVAALQTEMMGELQKKLAEALANQDPESLMKIWMPTGLKGLEAMQAQFWQAMMAGKPPFGGTPPNS